MFVFVIVIVIVIVFVFVFLVCHRTSGLSHVCSCDYLSGLYQNPVVLSDDYSNKNNEGVIDDDWSDGEW